VPGPPGGRRLGPPRARPPVGGVVRRHRFLAGLGPFEHRPSAPGSGTPTSPDCARVTPRGLRLGVRPGPWRCAAVHAPSWAFVEGRLEFRARFPGPAGFHSAAWLQSPTPYASAEDQEVDAAEHFGAGRVHHAVWAGP